jgi:DNA-directed RNA polymerase subunit alpha
METTTTTDLASLFKADPNDRDAFDQLKEAAFESSETLNRFRELLGALETESQAAPSAKAAYKLGLCYLFLADNDKAAAWLEKASGIPEHALHLGRARREQHRFSEAIALFEAAATQGADRLECDLQRAECHLVFHDAEAAEKIVTQHRAARETSPYFHFIEGRLAEERGDLDRAMDAYESALVLDPAHPEAMFRLAYLLDLHGNDDRANELYLQCSEQPYVYANALINLAVNFEDLGDYENAAGCLWRVLSVNPNHERAELYLKDVLAAQEMFIDEAQLRAKEQTDAVLDIPVTDFELSVRSRNCLKKMNIHTLGDLLMTTEQELLAYKNFGETSLREIKAMLAQKGLLLGQNARVPQSEQPAAVPAAPATVVSPELLARPVSSVELSVRSRKCLQRLGINTLSELVSRSEAELLESKNFGQTSLREIKGKLIDMGLSLRLT